MSERLSGQLPVLLLGMLLCCSVPGAHSSRSETFASALSHRKLLACSVVKDPRYSPKDGSQSLPLCATQYLPTGSNQWEAVTVGSPRSGPIKVTAADLAAAWSKDPDSPKTDSVMQCTGDVDQESKECWAGKGIETDATFTSISCCSTNVVCYIKMGGCVLH